MKIGNLPRINFRKNFTQWEWYKDTVTKCVFLHLLLTANTSDTSSVDMKIKRGQLATTQKNLEEDLGLSRQSVRTALGKLKQAGEIEIAATNKFSVITICKYDSYQDEKEYANQCATNKSTNKEERITKSDTNSCRVEQKQEQPTEQPAYNIDNITRTRSRYINISPPRTRNIMADVVNNAREAEIERLRQSFLGSELKVEAAMRSTRIFDKAALEQMAEEVFADWTLTEEADITWRHFQNALYSKAAAARVEAARLAAIPKPKQDLNEWKQDIAREFLEEAALRMSGENMNKNGTSWS